MTNQSNISKQIKLEERAMPMWQLRALRTGCLRSCVNCGEFIKDTEGCNKAGGTRPPATIIALGCDSWWQEIPF